MPQGLYISVPFCRSKCSFCNFASGVFSRGSYQGYVERVCRDIELAEQTAGVAGGAFDRSVDAVYLGGGTPTVLEPAQIGAIFWSIRRAFDVVPGAEITVECAPASLTSEMLDALVLSGVNRVSLGVQSFVDQESRAVGRLHSRSAALDDIARLRAAGIAEINVDLIAGLPHQTPESWRYSLEETVATGATHASVYMLEIDEDSRLGKELIAGGTRYHAHFVPDEDLTADFYEQACEFFDSVGLRQYEISNFARKRHESRHNLKYWTRQPYLGFGVDAHSMLQRIDGAAVRFATTDSLDRYIAGEALTITEVSRESAIEEEFFLGLRLRDGVNLDAIRSSYGAVPEQVIQDLVDVGLLEREAARVRLTPRGRLLSNDVFEKFISSGGPASSPIVTAGAPLVRIDS